MPASLAFDAVPPIQTPLGLFCPPGHYMVCPDGFFHGCDCIKGARAWKWWEKRPSPLWPQSQRPAPSGQLAQFPAPRPGAQLGQTRRRRRHFTAYR